MTVLEGIAPRAVRRDGLESADLLARCHRPTKRLFCNSVADDGCFGDGAGVGRRSKMALFAVMNPQPIIQESGLTCDSHHIDSQWLGVSLNRNLVTSS
jgi:hypothetical protein